MSLTRFLVAILIVIVSSTGVWAADFKNIVIVSIDALHPSSFTKEYAPITFAHLKGGSVTRLGVSTSPPKTLIAHSAMMTGKGPQDGGRVSNSWTDGEPTVQGETIFHDAKERGYRTGFFYSKPKLGFLENNATDIVTFSSEYAIEKALHFIKEGDKSFVFIHVSGLDIVGPLHGWMSAEYIEELSYIDQYLEGLYERLERDGKYLLIITSDHGGYGKSHGGSHPEEAKLPFGVVSDVCSFPEIEGMPYAVTQLRKFIARVEGRNGCTLLDH